MNSEHDIHERLNSILELHKTNGEDIPIEYKTRAWALEQPDIDLTGKGSPMWQMLHGTAEGRDELEESIGITFTELVKKGFYEIEGPGRELKHVITWYSEMDFELNSSVAEVESIFTPSNLLEYAAKSNPLRNNGSGIILSQIFAGREIDEEVWASFERIKTDQVNTKNEVKLQAAAYDFKGFIENEIRIGNDIFTPMKRFDHSPLKISAAAMAFIYSNPINLSYILDSPKEVQDKSFELDGEFLNLKDGMKYMMDKDLMSNTSYQTYMSMLNSQEAQNFAANVANEIRRNLNA